VTRMIVRPMVNPAGTEIARDLDQAPVIARANTSQGCAIVVDISAMEVKPDDSDGGACASLPAKSTLEST